MSKSSAAPLSFTRLLIAALLLTSSLATPHAHAFAPQSDTPRDLPPDQTLERELKGAETHRYKFDLKAGDFFHVRAEQKGIDVTLKLSDADGNALATMDSPNGKEGFETLSFVAAKAGGFVLEIISFDAKAGAGLYAVRREAPRPATAKDERRLAVERIFVEGMKARNTRGQLETALAKLEAAAEGWRELGDGYLTDLTEGQVKAVKVAIKTEVFIAEFTAPTSLVTEGQKILREGKPESILAARTKFTAAVEAARRLLKKLDDESPGDFMSKDDRAEVKLITKMNEVNGLSGISSAYDLLKDWEESVSYNRLALAAIEEIRHDPQIRASKALASYPLPLKVYEANLLNSIGTTLTSRLNKPREGLTANERALTLWREVRQEYEKFRETAEYKQGLTLQSMGQSYFMLDDRKRAAECFEQALPHFRKLAGQQSLEALTLLQMGNIYSEWLDYEKAREVWHEALKLYEGLGDKRSQAAVLEQIGLTYFSVQSEKKAREYFDRELALLLSDDYLESSMKQGSVMPFPSLLQGAAPEWPSLSHLNKDAYEWQRSVSIGNVYSILGDDEKAREYYEKGLAPARSLKKRDMVRLSLTFIGSTYSNQNSWQKALDYYKQSLALSRQLTKKSDIAGDLSSLAFVYLRMKRLPDAAQHAAEALLLYQLLGADQNNLFISYASALNLMARVQDELGNRRLAIFYEKNAVNAIQRERQQLKNLDRQEQRSYLKKNEKLYQRLADWLIEEGRLPEAEQVLRMLKEDEYFRYVRRDASELEKLAQRADLNEDERGALRRYNEISARLAEVGAEYSRLEEKRKGLPEGVSLPPAEARRLDELARQIEDADNVFQVFLRQLAEEFARTPKAAKVRDETARGSGLRSDLGRWRRELGDEGVVALYTVVGDDRYRVILTTPETQSDGKYEIRAERLREKVAAFRQAVQDPSLDPRPLGKELYDIIVKPIEKRLEAEKATTLLWSLDDTLRYVPLAALWDGRQYFGEKYQNVVITLASRTRLNEKPAAGGHVLGLGVSESKRVTLTEPDGATRSVEFLALSGVREELQAIVRDETAQGNQTGVLPGVRLLDSTFTEAALKEHLGRGYKVIHIASHFSFRPGDLTRSFLLLGDGQVLTLSKLKSNRRLAFTGVELLTLSACQTAVGDVNADGAEVESFGVIAQDTGAKAVLATLWSVDDESTSRLMSEFYRLKQENPRLTKAAALQLAQAALIAGKPARSPSESAGRGLGLGGQPPARAWEKSYAHPYYWSPFILIGNWR